LTLDQFIFWPKLPPNAGFGIKNLKKIFRGDTPGSPQREGATLSRTHPRHGYTPCAEAQAPPLLGPIVSETVPPNQNLPLHPCHFYDIHYAYTLLAELSLVASMKLLLRRTGPRIPGHGIYFLPIFSITQTCQKSDWFSTGFCYASESFYKGIVIITFESTSRTIPPQTGSIIKPADCRKEHLL